MLEIQVVKIYKVVDKMVKSHVIWEMASDLVDFWYWSLKSGIKDSFPQSREVGSLEPKLAWLPLFDFH